MAQVKSGSDVNPFSTRFWTPGAIPFRFCNENDLELLFQKLSYRKVHQIVGAHGSGKSALLETLRCILTHKGFEVVYAVLNDEKRRLPKEFIVPKKDMRQFYILDGYEQLSWQERWCLRRQHWQRTAGLLWTAHRPAWGIPVLYRTTASVEFFLETVRCLTQDTALGFDESFLRERFDRAHGNFRTVFFELYDRCSR